MLIWTRAAVLTSSASQRAHMKALQMANTLGLSNSLMRVIQRRTSGDKILVYGGMVLITVLLLIVYLLDSRLHGPHKMT